MKSISFSVKRGDIFTLLGPSGCGKTTTLQCVAGLETPTNGSILMDGEVVFDQGTARMVPANRRKLGMVFQSYAIWPHMTVFENVAFPLAHGTRRVESGDIRRRVLDALERVKLAEYADRPSPHLSGGQQQRVALARALVHEPRLLLLDEPLSNLDAKLRDDMRVEIRQLVKSLGITTLFVTHDQVEAMSMSDQIVLMRAGRILQVGTPREIFLKPRSRFVADFMGRSNIISGRVTAGSGAVETAIGLVACDVPSEFRAHDPVTLVIRPQAIQILSERAPYASLGNLVTGRVSSLNFLGETVEIEVRCGPLGLRITADPYLDLSIGQTISFVLPAERCVVVGPDEEERPPHAASEPAEDEPSSARIGVENERVLP
ncbi:ABC transporter ATP-binding protein [Xanthobacter sp. KR7-225]|uniref:ABC transporter ATP-binding protein n=1 Tax=Xanthobacter sp. KR7-225 TaxID=3156613 RepID=UPI0032B53138